MKTNEQAKQTILVSDTPPIESINKQEPDTRPAFERLKKPVIYTMMSIAFMGCMFMIFGSKEKDKSQMAKFNDTVPQASGGVLQADKQKAYELDMLEQKEQQKRASLMSLADYLGKENAEEKSKSETSERENSPDQDLAQNKSAALNSYQNIKHSVGSFYERNNNETEGLKMEVVELKRQLAEKRDHTPDPIATHTALMEKSFEMASRFLPNTQQQTSLSKDSMSKESPKPKGLPLQSTNSNVVSGLYREDSDGDLIETWVKNRNLRFFTSGQRDPETFAKYSIKACIHNEQTITENVHVRIRLLEPAKIKGFTLNEGSLLTAISKFQGNRLQLVITSIEHSGNIIPVEVTAYDTDGQAGLLVPHSPERSAITDIVANMGGTAGTNISMSSNAGQQIGSDMSRSLVQGVSGYFAKKVRSPRVIVSSGHRLLLVSKK